MGLVDVVLRPARPGLGACRDVAERMGADVAARRTRALTECQERIEAARVDVFAARDGVVTANMTLLEREWRRISRGDPEGEAMDVWARIAPPAWLDRKRWRGTPAPIEAAVLLAADVDGVEVAERAFAHVTWRPIGADWDGMPALVERAIGGASLLDETVHAAMRARFPERPHLARAVALAARADARTYWDLWRSGYVLGAVDGASATLEFPPAGAA